MSEDEQISGLFSVLGHTFRDPVLLDIALSHISAWEAGCAPGYYERLEFLGDRVLGLVIAERLYRDHPNEQEGGMAVRLNDLVCAKTCAEIAIEAGLGPYIRFSKGEARAGRKDNVGILADICESVIGALYMDGGLPAAAGFIDRFWSGRITRAARPPRDPKTILQEWTQKSGHPLPVYRVSGRQGPDHEPIFHVTAIIEGFTSEEGWGGSKRAAEQAAALQLLQREGLEE